MRGTIKEKDDKITATEVLLQQQLGDKDKTIATLQGWNKCINNYYHLNCFYVANERGYQTQGIVLLIIILCACYQ